MNHSRVLLLNRSVVDLYRKAFSLSIRQPSLAAFALRTFFHQRKAAKLRLQWEKQGTHVPPFLIASITDRCNLRCKGCYAHALRHPSQAELEISRFRSLFEEARELGVSEILLAGGEPLMRKEILDVTESFPDIVFPLFTNGYFLDEATVARLRRQRQIVPILSIEGLQQETDERRGEGTYDQLMGKVASLKKNGLFFGFSLTLTRDNFEEIVNEPFCRKLIEAGAKVILFIDYIPVDKNSEAMALSTEQRLSLTKRVAALNRHSPAIFISFPGDEEAFGGCLAAGRGFVHVSPRGDVEPCPFAPYSDTNLREHSLKESLQSDFLAKIRDNHTSLSETNGGCALWDKREWVKGLLPDLQPRESEDVSAS